jgi:hypothetical protein
VLIDCFLACVWVTSEDEAKLCIVGTVSTTSLPADVYKCKYDFSSIHAVPI